MAGVNCMENTSREAKGELDCTGPYRSSYSLQLCRVKQSFLGFVQKNKMTFSFNVVFKN